MAGPLYRFFSRPHVQMLMGLAGGALCGGISSWGARIAVFLIFLCLLWILKTSEDPKWRSPVNVGFFVVAALSVYFTLHPVLPGNHIANYTGRAAVIVEGRIAMPLDPGRKKTRLIVETAALTKPGQKRRPARGRLGVTVYGPCTQTLYTGDPVRFSAVIYRPRPPTNPYAFNYKRFLALRGIYAVTYLKDFSEVVVLRDTGVPSILGFMDRARQRLNRWITTVVQRPYNTLIAAMLIGYRGKIPAEIREVFRRCGTSHLLAISGLHLGIVAVLLFVVIKRLVGFFPGIFLYMDVQRLTAFLTFVCLLFYLFLTGSRISTVRAFLMAAGYFSILALRRTCRLEDLLLFAAFLILFFQPQALFDSSFQLTFSAVGGILLGVKQKEYVIEEGGERETLVKKRLRWLGITAWITVLAMAATFPILGYHFHRVSPLGIFANLFGVPFVSFLILPVGMAALAVFPISTTFATFLVKFDGKLMAILVKGFSRFSHFPFSQVNISPFRWYEIILYYLALVFVLLALRSWRDKRRRWRNGGIAVAAVLAMGIAAVLYGPSGTFLEIFHVKKGVYLAVSCKRGHATLICNGLGDSPSRDDAKWVLIPYLLNKRIRKIDTVVVANNQPVNLRAVTTLLAFKTPDCLAGAPAVLYSLKNMLPLKAPAVKWLESPGIFKTGPLTMRMMGELPPGSRDRRPVFSRGRRFEGIVFSCRALEGCVPLARDWLPPLAKDACFSLFITAVPGKIESYFSGLTENLWVIGYSAGRRGHRITGIKNFVDLKKEGAVEISEGKDGWRVKTFLGRRNVPAGPAGAF